jgi:YVTN family beta-propeller protein
MNLRAILWSICRVARASSRNVLVATRSHPKLEANLGGVQVKFVNWSAVLGTAVLLSSCLFGGPYTVGGTVTGLQGSGLVLQNSSGKYLSVTQSGSFTFSSGLNDGQTYSVTVRTQPSNPTQTCTVANGTGTIEKADVTNVLVTCSSAGSLAFVANQTANTISAYIIDTSTGYLTPVTGSPFASTGVAPIAATVDPNGTYLYVANNSSDTVSVYTINTTTGVLTSNGLIATGNGPIAIAIDPTDAFMYVANVNDDTVSAYTLSNGTATQISGSPFGGVGHEPSSLKVDPSGSYLYVTNFTDGTVSALAIDSTTGALTSVIGTYTAGVGAQSLGIDPTGQFVYAANESAASISGFTITSGTGQLTAVPGSPLATGSSPEALVADPSGKYLYAANVTSNNTIATYGITPSTGALTLLSTAGAGTLPVAVAVDPSGSFVYAVNNTSGSVSVYSVDAATGALTPVTGSPFAAGVGARSIAIE